MNNLHNKERRASCFCVIIKFVLFEKINCLISLVRAQSIVMRCCLSRNSDNRSDKPIKSLKI